MKDSPSIFIDTALLALFLVGVQYSDFDSQKANSNDKSTLIEFSRSL